MGDVVKFPTPEVVTLPELSEEQTELITLLGYDATSCGFVELSGFDQGTNQTATIVLPSIMWRGHIRVIFPDGNMIIRNSLEPRW